MKFILLYCLLKCALQSDAQNVVDLIKETFYFDFSTDMDIGDVLAWRISKDQTKFKPLNNQECRAVFHSKGTVLVLTHKIKRTWQFHYWAGNEAYLDDKRTLVRYTMMFYLSALEYYDRILDWGPVIYLSREQEGIETFPFEEAKFGLVNKTQVKTFEEHQFYQSYQDAHVPANIPNLYAVRGKEFTRIKKVSLHADWLNVADACLILEVGIYEKGMVPINIACGPDSSENAQLRSEKFAKKFYYYWYESKMTYEYINFLGPEDPIKLKFEDIVKTGNLHNLYEIDDQKDRVGSAEEFVNKSNGAYLLDTKNAAGIFLIVGEDATDAMKKRAVEVVEIYLHKDTVKQLPTRMRIMKRNGVAAEPYVDFSIHLADWPKKFDEAGNPASNPFW